MRRFIISVNGNQYEVDVEEITNGATSSPRPIEPKPVVAQAPTPPVSPVLQSEPIAVSNGADLVSAPMPGVILSVNVKEGDMVKAGETLMILEAMKMENEILAPRDGRIVNIFVNKDASVDTGEQLVTIE